MSIPQGRIDICERAPYLHMGTIGPRIEPRSGPKWANMGEERCVVISMPAKWQQVKKPRVDLAVAFRDICAAIAYRCLELRDTVEAVEYETDHRPSLAKGVKKYMGRDDYQFGKSVDAGVTIRIGSSRANMSR